MNGNLSVVGLGKLGACTAACFAAKGFEVFGYDVNSTTLEAVALGRAPVDEPGLQRIMDQALDRLRVTDDPHRLIDETDVTFLIVPTPSRTDGSFSNEYVQTALENLGAALATSGKADHLFVITSTVSPRACEQVFLPLLEDVTGRRLNHGFRLAYNPEFIALGSVVRDFLNPDLVLIGESDREAGDQLQAIYDKVCDNTPAVARMSLVSAEITKLSLNAFVTMKISFANMLSNLCEGIDGADVDAITAALGADRRVSPHGLRGGPPYGGPCFPRDNRALLAFSGERDYRAHLPSATDAVNQLQIDRLLTHVERACAEHDSRSVAILGMAYKPGTSVIEESTGIKLAHRLLEQGLEVTTYDPIALDNVRRVLKDAVTYAASPGDCYGAAPVCVLTLPDRAYQALDPEALTHIPTTVIDCWRQLPPQRLTARIVYVPLGRAS